MPTRLPSGPPRLQRVELAGAEVILRHPLLAPEAAAAALQALIAQTPWRCDDIVLFGRRLPQPRLTAWYGDPGCRYRYSGLALQPLPWTPLLQQLRSLVEAACSATFNSVLLNYYRDQHDSMGLHSDDEPELGPRPLIASLSLGEPRILSFAPRRDRGLAGVKLPLPSGSLLVMRGDTQTNWKHGIGKSKRPLGPRVNLTFRRMLAPPPAPAAAVHATTPPSRR